MENLRKVYLSRAQFEKDLDDCLTIISYPSKTRKFYVCEYISPALLKSKVKIFVKRFVYFKNKLYICNNKIKQ